MRIWIGNIVFQTSEEQLRELLEEFGTVDDLYYPDEPGEERKRGFAFVTYATEESAQNAKVALAGREHMGRELKTNDATERQPRPGGGRRSGPPRGDRGNRGGRKWDR